MLLWMKTVTVVVALSFNISKTAGFVQPKFEQKAEYHPNAKRDVIIKGPDDLLHRFFGSKRDRYQDKDDWQNKEHPWHNVDVAELEKSQQRNGEREIERNKNALLEIHPFNLAIGKPSNGPLNQAFRSDGKARIQAFDEKRVQKIDLKSNGPFAGNDNKWIEEDEPATAGAQKPDLLDDIMNAKGLFGKRSQFNVNGEVKDDVGFQNKFASLYRKNSNMNDKMIGPQKYKLQAFMGKRLNNNFAGKTISDTEGRDGGNRVDMGLPLRRFYGIMKKQNDLSEDENDLIHAQFGIGKTGGNGANDISNKNMFEKIQRRSQKNYWMDFQTEIQDLANENAKLRGEKKRKGSMMPNSKLGVPRMNIYMG